jgi:magnesium chelatase family protein
MLAKLNTFSRLCIDAQSVEMEVDVSSGALPKIGACWIAGTRIKESTHCIERAIVSSRFMRLQSPP